MNVLFTKQFAKDIKNLHNKSVAAEIEAVIMSAKDAETLSEIKI